MKLLITSDLHIGANNNSEQLFNYQLKVLNYILDVYKSYQCDYLCINGDFFDKRKNIDINIYNKIRKEFLDKTTDIKYIVLAGNHDCYFKNTNETNSLSLLNSYKNITLVSEGLYKLGNVSFIPWITADNRSEIENKLLTDDADYLMCHIELNGARLDSYNRFTGPDSLNRDTINHYKKVFSGHFHVYSRNGNVIYIGSPFQLTWIDVNVPKFVFILDTETHELTEILIPYHLFIQFHITKDDWKEYCNDNIKDKRVKIFYDDDLDKKLFIDIQNEFIKINPDIQFIKKSSKEISKDKITIDESKPLMEYIMDYIDNIKPENTEMVKSFFKKIYNT